ncbi:DeoR/GlpR family DNA-binding transcription regulator, partial [Klebsiella pneumoniae]
QGSFQHRTLLHSEGKMRVARKALQFLQPGQTIVLDGSSTSWFLARQMPEMALTVITPSIRILQTLMSRRSLHLVGLGGDFSPTEESFFGETASRTLREYAIDTLFFSCQGLERDSGLYAGTQAHAALLKQMLLAARQTVALVDGSKLGRTGVARIGGLGELDCLVTERFVDPLLEKEMTWHNVSLQIA